MSTPIRTAENTRLIVRKDHGIAYSTRNRLLAQIDRYERHDRPTEPASRAIWTLIELAEMASNHDHLMPPAWFITGATTILTRNPQIA